jgi:hypothetical protein
MRIDVLNVIAIPAALSLARIQRHVLDLEPVGEGAEGAVRVGDGNRAAGDLRAEMRPDRRRRAAASSRRVFAHVIRSGAPY